MNDLVVLQYFLNRHEAGMAKGLLDEQGIVSVIDADDCGGARQGMSIARIRLMVPQGDFDRAKKAIEILGLNQKED